jgi:hypothetical protein
MSGLSVMKLMYMQAKSTQVSNGQDLFSLSILNQRLLPDMDPEHLPRFS